MKVIILCGGLGTRISEETKKIPKPMIKIQGKPILEHIINYYEKFKFSEFILATGYKANVIEKHFNVKKFKNKKIKSVYTGLNTNTGGRIFKLKKYLSPSEDFMLTYGDGLSNHNLKKLYQFYKKKKKIGVVTGVRPPYRNGEIKFNKNNIINNFKEKHKSRKGWINGGFFILNYKIFSFFKNKNEVFERGPLERLVKKKQLSVFLHHGIWQCMDTIRDKKRVEELIRMKKIG